MSAELAVKNERDGLSFAQNKRRGAMVSLW